MKWLKISLAWGLGFAALFGLVPLIFDFGDWSHWVIASSIGFFCGLLAAPDFDKKAFKSPTYFK
jgi:hypothetical protein